MNTLSAQTACVQAPLSRSRHVTGSGDRMALSIMSVEHRAAQLWPLLAYAATRHQILTYGEVGKLMGVAPRGLGRLLEPLQSYCLLRKIPPITAIMVRRNTGRPGSGFSATPNPTQDQHEVFAFRWLEHQS